MKRIFTFVTMMMLWVVLSGHMNLFFLIAGCVCSAVSLWISEKFRNVIEDDEYVGFPPTKTGFFALTKGFVVYGLWLIIQVVLSTVYVVKKILRASVSSGTEKPVTAAISTKQLSGIGEFMLLASITMTPGTVGMCVTRDSKKVKVLAFDKELLDGVTEIDNKICEIFE